jgi:L-tyrosine isonitrile synthase
MASSNAVARDFARVLPNNPQPTCSRSEDVLKAFNTWAFKREQPSNADLLRSFVSRAVTQDEPLSFVAYWGKGPRDDVAEPDHRCLQYLKQMMDRIGAVHHAGTELHLVLTDTHARLNGHRVRSINKYFGAIEAEAANYGYSSWRLKTLTDSMRPALKMISCADMDYPAELVGELQKSAAKWYRGGHSVEAGARRYFDMNMVERRVMERVFPNSVFLTFNSSDMRILFPERLPVFYMYSIKKGVGVKPWFQ